jgi:site-specific DNA recombinase
MREQWTDGEMIPAKFEGAISRDEWIELQKALDGKGRKGVKLPRKKFNPDFPLRQFLCCPKCGKRATGSPSIGKMKKKYFYYSCPDRKGCKWGVRAETANDLFRTMLRELRPSDESLALFREMVVEKWKTRYQTLSADAIAQAKKVTELKERKANLFRLIESCSDAPELVADMKKEYQQISQDILFATGERQEKEHEEYDAETVLNHCSYFMANAHELWERAPVEEKFRFQSLIFPDGIRFDVLEGKRTPQMSLVYEAIRELQMPKNLLAGPRGIEPRFAG